MPRLPGSFFLCLSLLSSPAWSATLSVAVSDAAGKPLEGAVVTVSVAGAAKVAPAGTTAEMTQQNRQFAPRTLVVQAGTSVHFPNLDTVRHHVYSFSPVKPFELKLYAGTPAAPVLFDRPGIDGLVQDLVPRLAADATIGAFFKDTNLRELKKQLADQLCAVSGGGCAYEGDDMKHAHATMKIAKADFNRMVEVQQDAMDARAIPFADQNRLLARLTPMHHDVITVR